VRSSIIESHAIPNAGDPETKPDNEEANDEDAGSDPPGTVKGSLPEVIDGREYPGHAVDQMKTRGVSSDQVNEAIAAGREKPGNTPGTVVKELPAAQSQSGRGLRVVLDRASGRVVTLMDKGTRFK